MDFVDYDLITIVSHLMSYKILILQQILRVHALIYLIIFIILCMYSIRTSYKKKKKKGKKHKI